jgi:tripartite ATP-independent transporter DctP family solute receptor
MKKSTRVLLFVLGLAILLMSSAQAFAESKYRMKVASVGSETHPSSIALGEVKQFIEHKTGKNLEVSLYLNSALGADRQITEGMQLGTIECGVIGTTNLANFDPKFNVFDLPFLFKSKEAAYKSIDGQIGKTLDESLRKQGLRIIAWGVNGYRHITNNRGPITKPDDLKGLKIRCMENPVHVATFKRMGANPTPMSFSELYTALAQKTVDAQENPINLVYSSKFYEVQKFYSLTGHLYAVVPLVVSEKWFQGLPKDIQAAVLEGGKLYQKRERAINETQEKGMLEEMKKLGLQVNVLTPDQKKAFITATLPIYDQFKDRIGADMVELAKQANQ